MIHSAEKNLKEFGDKVSEQEKNAIENDIKALKEAVASDDTDKIKSGLEALTQSSMKLGEAMYKAQQQDAPNPNEPSDNTAAGSDQNNEKLLMLNSRKSKKIISNRKQVSLCQKETIMKFLAFPSQLMTLK